MIRKYQRTLRKCHIRRVLAERLQQTLMAAVAAVKTHCIHLRQSLVGRNFLAMYAKQPDKQHRSLLAEPAVDQDRTLLRVACQTQKCRDLVARGRVFVIARYRQKADAVFLAHRPFGRFPRVRIVILPRTAQTDDGSKMVFTNQPGKVCRPGLAASIQNTRLHHRKTAQPVERKPKPATDEPRYVHVKARSGGNAKPYCPASTSDRQS